MQHRQLERRRWVAALAVYALLFQALFAGFLAAPMAVAAPSEAGVLCAHPGHDQPSPADHRHADHAECCILCGFALAGTALPPAAAGLPLRRLAERVPPVRPGDDGPPFGVAEDGPRARGPPLQA